MKENALTGGGLRSFLEAVKKSAEVIVVNGNEPMNELEVSQVNEGLNIELFQMLYEMNNSHTISGTETFKSKDD
jgi:hypothetical protein